MKGETPASMYGIKKDKFAGSAPRQRNWQDQESAICAGAAVLKKGAKFAKEQVCEICATHCSASMIAVIYTKAKDQLKERDNDWYPYEAEAKTNEQVMRAMKGSDAKVRAKDYAKRPRDKECTTLTTVCSCCHGMKFLNWDEENNRVEPGPDVHHKADGLVAKREETDDAGMVITRNRAKVTAQWGCLARASKTNQSSSHFQRIMSAEKTSRLQRQEYLVGNAAEVVAAWMDNQPSPVAAMTFLLKSPNFAAACDWVSGVGPGVWQLYGCTGCHIVPLQANGWYLVNVKYDYEQDTFVSKSNAGQKWRCACCIEDYVGSED